MATEPQGEQTVRLTDCAVDLARGVVLRRDGAERLRLSTRERELLRFLAERAPQAATRDELLQRVWGYSDAVYSRACDSAVRRLRTKIERDPSAPDHLLTAHGSGYQLVLGLPSDGRAARPPAARGWDLSAGPVRFDLAALRYEGPRGAGRLTPNEVAVLRRLAQD
ncbi:MAG: helix-turn-helix domain-containing protein, partial [Myxococcota bacterium]